MMITVQPCFHWIGYHISSYLLQEGIEVIGIDSMTSALSEFFYMNVGRNSNFQHLYNAEDRERFVHLGAEERMIQCDDSEGVLICKCEKEEQVIEIPPLFGEWMDLSKLEIRSEKELQSWVQEREAVYIQDFLKSILPLLLQENMEDASNGRGGSWEFERVEQHIESVWNSYHQIQSYVTDL